MEAWSGDLPGRGDGRWSPHRRVTPRPSGTTVIGCVGGTLPRCSEAPLTLELAQPTASLHPKPTGGLRDRPVVLLGNRGAQTIAALRLGKGFRRHPKPLNRGWVSPPTLPAWAPAGREQGAGLPYAAGGMRGAGGTSGARSFHPVAAHPSPLPYKSFHTVWCQQQRMNGARSRATRVAEGWRHCWKENGEPRPCPRWVGRNAQAGCA